MRRKIRILATGGIVTTFLLVGGNPVLAEKAPVQSALFDKSSARGDLFVDFESSFNENASDFPIYANDDFQNYIRLGDGLQTRQEAYSALGDQGFSPSQINDIIKG